MKHNYTTEDLLLYVSGEGSKNWRTDLRNDLFDDKELTLQFREVKRWERLMNKLIFQPSERSLNTIKDYARQSMTIALC